MKRFPSSPSSLHGMLVCTVALMLVLVIMYSFSESRDGNDMVRLPTSITTSMSSDIETTRIRKMLSSF